MENRVVTCVYCGHEYPDQTPTSGAEVLTEHIKVCSKHPLRKVEADIALLRKALAGIIGADTKSELEKRVAAINAIHALLATMPVPPSADRPPAAV